MPNISEILHMPHLERWKRQATNSYEAGTQTFPTQSL